MMDDCYINNLAKNQVSAVFHSPVIRRSLAPKFIELIWYGSHLGNLCQNLFTLRWKSVIAGLLLVRS